MKFPPDTFDHNSGVREPILMRFEAFDAKIYAQVILRPSASSMAIGCSVSLRNWKHPV
jgi:hypothetical protein